MEFSLPLLLSHRKPTRVYVMNIYEYVYVCTLMENYSEFRSFSKTLRLIPSSTVLMILFDHLL